MYISMNWINDYVDLSGIDTEKYKMLAYLISGIGAGFAAVFWSAYQPAPSRKLPHLRYQRPWRFRCRQRMRRMRHP